MSLKSVFLFLPNIYHILVSPKGRYHNSGQKPKFEGDYNPHREKKVKKRFNYELNVDQNGIYIKKNREKKKKNNSYWVGLK